ncbi:hypothetical protein [Vibrio sp. B1Z05]|uniref:hypothetical protein n=1 Tax=Vibrio sp. B1Z05 TaxID=2654980 RepID=UPI00128E20DE|nr:hypothetical protein [Vibrio sp. B1Z05]MPW37637.1 hypothetical protein [Vibrio sp. B1Z05]
MIDPAKTIEIIRRWDRRDKAKSHSGTELDLQITEIMDAWEAFRACEATMNQQFIAYQVHRYLMNNTNIGNEKPITRNYAIHRMVKNPLDKKMTINKACKEVAKRKSLDAGSVMTSYRNWKRDKDNIERAIRYHHENCVLHHILDKSKNAIPYCKDELVQSNVSSMFRRAIKWMTKA